MLSNKTIEVIRVCLKFINATGNEKSKQDTKEALDEFNEFICDLEKCKDGLIINKYKKTLEQNLNKQECPSCGCNEIGIYNWNAFEDERDWFYYCKKCENIFK